MRKKNWLIGSVAAAAVVICGAVGINSVKAADTDANAAKSAKEEFVYEQVGLDSYDSVYTGKSTTWLTSDEGKKISVIGKDGTIYSIDNTDGKYGEIAAMTSAYSYDGYVYSNNADHKETLFNFDGSYVADNGGYHDKVYTLTLGGKKYFEFIDSDKKVVKAEDGTDIIAQIADGNKEVSGIRIIADSYLLISYSDKTYAYFDKDLNSIDFEGKVAQDGYKYSYANPYGKNYIRVTYYKDGETDYHNIFYKYYDYSLNEYANVSPVSAYNDNIEGAVPPYDSPERIKTSDLGQIFASENRLSHSESEKYSLEDDYTASYTGALLGYKVILGYKTSETDKKVNSYAMFDENGVKLLDNVMQSSRADKLVVTEDGKYKIYAVSLKSASGETNITVDENKNSVAEVVAKEVDVRDLKDENGKKITVDDLDADAKAVMNQKFDFKLVAAENVIPEGTKLSVSKVVAGKEYAAAKTVTAEVAERVAVFNIDLLNTENVKVQPNGKLEITTDVPTGYDVSRIAVYRLSEDGTSYIKLESKVVDGKVVFETDHFSTYMIVEEKSEVTENPVINDGENPAANDGNQTASDDGTKGGNVQTGDIPMAGIIALIAVLALAGVSLVVSSKKSRA